MELQALTRINSLGKIVEIIICYNIQPTLSGYKYTTITKVTKFLPNKEVKRADSLRVFALNNTAMSAPIRSVKWPKAS